MIIDLYLQKIETLTINDITIPSHMQMDTNQIYYIMSIFSKFKYPNVLVFGVGRSYWLILICKILSIISDDIYSDKYILSLIIT